MDNEFRRLFPPSRRRPNPLVVVGRWWLEIVLAATVFGAGCWAVEVLGEGLAVVSAAVLLGGTATATVVSETCRLGILSLVQRVIVPHRLRLGLVQGGVTNRTGHLPTIVRARCRADQVRIWLYLPAGLVIGDLVAAREVLAASCGAVDVLVLPNGPSRNRAMLVVVRPRWGWPGG